MTIQTGEGPIRVDPDDLQINYRGKTIAVKVRSLIWPVVLGVQRMSDGTWQVGADLTDDLFGSDVPGEPDPVAYWLKKHGGGMGFVQNIILPRLNAWLTTVYPATDTPAAPLDQLQAALAGVRFVPQPDGTLQARV